MSDDVDIAEAVRNAAAVIEWADDPNCLFCPADSELLARALIALHEENGQLLAGVERLRGNVVKLAEAIVRLTTPPGDDPERIRDEIRSGAWKKP